MTIKCSKFWLCVWLIMSGNYRLNSLNLTLYCIQLKLEIQLMIPIQNRLNASGGPIQLWQFLVEMLLDRSARNCIIWTGKDWEFRMGKFKIIFILGLGVDVVDWIWSETDRRSDRQSTTFKGRAWLDSRFKGTLILTLWFSGSGRGSQTMGKKKK